MKFISIFSIILLLSAGVSDLSAMQKSKPMQCEERKTPAQKKSGKQQKQKQMVGFGLERFTFDTFVKPHNFRQPTRKHSEHSHKSHFRPPTPPRPRPADQPSLKRKGHLRDEKELSYNNDSANKKRRVGERKKVDAAVQTESDQEVKKVHAAMQTESDAKQDIKKVDAAVQTEDTPGVTVGMDNHQSFANLCAPSEQQIKSLLIVDKTAGIAPIHYLAIKKNEDILAVLGTAFQQSLYSITSAEFFNALDACKRTPLHHAVQHKHYTLVEWLLIHDADINAQDANGFTPLHIAAQDRDEKMIRILVEARARKDLISREGQAPLHIFTSIPCGDVINEEHELALIRHLIHEGRLHKAEDLLDAKDLKEPDHKNVITLWKQYADCCQLLMDDSINDVTDATGRTPMIYALEHRTIPYLYVLTHHSNINWFRTTVLGRRPYIEYLETIEAPIPDNVMNESDAEEAFNNNKYCAKLFALFCTLPASVDFETYLLNTAENIVHKLLQKKSLVSFMITIILNKTVDAKRAFEKENGGYDFEPLVQKALDYDGNTMLHLAAYYNVRYFAGCLMKHAPDLAKVLQAKNRAGQTALDIAFENKHFPFACRLLFKARDIRLLDLFTSLKPEHIKVLMDCSDDHGNTFLHAAAEDGSESLIRVFACNPKNLKKKNNAGKTPFDLAYENQPVDRYRDRYIDDRYIGNTFKVCMQMLGAKKPFYVLKAMKQQGAFHRYRKSEILTQPLDQDNNTLMHYIMKKAKNVEELLEAFKEIGIDLENDESHSGIFDDGFYRLFQYAKDRNNKSALECAFDEKRPVFGFEFLKVLMAAKKQGFGLFWELFAVGGEAIKPFVKMVDHDGNTLLHLFMYQVAQRPDFFKDRLGPLGNVYGCFVKAGADLTTVQNKAGQTVLDMIKTFNPSFQHIILASLGGCYVEKTSPSEAMNNYLVQQVKHLERFIKDGKYASKKA